MQCSRLSKGIIFMKEHNMYFLNPYIRLLLCVVRIALMSPLSRSYVPLSMPLIMALTVLIYTVMGLDRICIT